MPLYYDEEGNEVDLENLPLNPNIREENRRAKKVQKELEEAQAELAAYKRQSALNSAGIPDTPLGKLFLKAYDGPMDADAIRRSAEEYGVLTPPVVAPPAEVPQNELEELRKAQGATVGSSGSQPDPMTDLEAKIASAKNPNEIMALLDQAKSMGLNIGLSSNVQ